MLSSLCVEMCLEGAARSICARATSSSQVVPGDWTDAEHWDEVTDLHPQVVHVAQIGSIIKPVRHLHQPVGSRLSAEVFGCHALLPAHETWMWPQPDLRMIGA